MSDIGELETQAIEPGDRAYTEDEAAMMLKNVRDEWRIVHYDTIMKLENGYQLDSYEDVCRFVGIITKLCRDSSHAPDITFGKDYAFIALHTPEVSGLHKNDFIVAAKIDILVAE